MHRITKFDLDKCYNQYVDPKIVEIMKNKIKEYNLIAEAIKFLEKTDDVIFNNKEKEHTYNLLIQEKINELKRTLQKLYLEILYSNPAGFTLTARMTTNYRCLRNIYI